MKKKIVEHLFEVNTIECLEESGDKKYIISGPFTKVDEPNGNNRIYPKEVMQKAIDKCKKKVAKKQVRMSLDHPGWEGKLADAAAIMLEISDIKEDGKAYYKAQIVDTTAGKNLKALLDAGSCIGVSTRGYGDALYDQEWPNLPGKYTVIKEGFELETVDFVDTPSVSETQDDITLESLKRSESTMKTIEELRKEFPETFEAFDKVIAEEKKTLTDAIENLKAQMTTATENFSKIVDLIKVVNPSAFTTIPESEIVAKKDEAIKDFETKVSELEKTASELKAKVESVEADKIKAEKEKEIETLKSTDVDYFKVPELVAKFESCVNAEEVRKVYESNKALLDSMKKSLGVETKNPKTNVDKQIELTDNQKRDLDSKNSDRKAMGLSPITVESYLKTFGK